MARTEHYEFGRSSSMPRRSGATWVPGRRVTTADELVSALHSALADAGPHLLEAVL